MAYEDGISGRGETVPVVLKMRQQVHYSKLPWGIWLLEKLGCCCVHPTTCYKALILVLTFCCYTSYHLSRKPSSVVKVALCPVCAGCNMTCKEWNMSNASDSDYPGWAPFDDPSNGKRYLGVLDYSWLFSYAITMYFSGFLSDRLNLRYFLTVGMIGSGVSVSLLGVAYFASIHKFYYFILVQLFVGIFQSTGWPGIVAVMSHWFGKHNRGLIMGVWNSHISVGNILGTIIPSFWADCGELGDQKPWGWSFLIPGFIIIFFGILTYLFMVTDPTHVGCPPPVHHLQEDLEESKPPEDNIEHSSVQDSYQSPPEQETSEDTEELIRPSRKPKKSTIKAINPLRALMIPGVVEYSVALFFNKLVSYTFLFWLPFYVKSTHGNLSGPQSDWLSTAFDVGGIFGGIIAGVVSDFLNARAITCVTMLLLAVPMLFVLRFVETSLGVFILLLVINGLLINGPYGMITTAVSSDLGTHPSLKANTNAKATVTAIIDGTGSLGAAVGPLLVGLISPHRSWNNSFYLLMVSCTVSALMLSRLLYYDAKRIVTRLKRKFAEPRASRDTVELQRLQSFSDSEQ